MGDPERKPLPIRVGMTLEEEERELIAATLELTGWNIRTAAAILGIDRSTLYAKISRYSIIKYSSGAPRGGL
jgi:transcriptional regulator of acetoin/glycerol metabolism